MEMFHVASTIPKYLGAGTLYCTNIFVLCGLYGFYHWVASLRYIAPLYPQLVGACCVISEPTWEAGVALRVIRRHSSAPFRIELVWCRVDVYNKEIVIGTDDW